MKKYLAILCASMMCACCLALAACGGSGSSAAASSAAVSGSASASAAASSASAATEADLTGEWKLAAVDYQGVTMVGDFSVLLEDTANVTLNLKADGTGSMTMGSDSGDLTWTRNGNDVTLTANSKDLAATYEDDAIAIKMQDADFNGTMYLTKDGTFKNATVISAEGAQNVTTSDNVVGEWKLCALTMMGVTMYGDADALASAIGDTNTTLALNADGSATVFGTDGLAYSITDKGLELTADGDTLVVKKLDDKLVIDATEIYGSSMVMVFSK